MPHLEPVQSIVNYMHIVMQLTPRTSPFWMTETLQHWTTTPSAAHPLQTLVTTILLCVSMSLTTLDTACKSNYTNIQYLSFCDGLISLNIIPSKFIHVIVYKQEFLFKGWIDHIPLYLYTTFVSVHSSVDRHWSCFYLQELFLKYSLFTATISVVIHCYTGASMKW